VLPEINRVLKPGARAIITMPFCWNEHEPPHDYARYTSFGLAHLLSKHGFRIIQLEKWKLRKSNFQLWALYFFELFRRFNRIGYILSLIFIIPINLAGSLLLLLLPKTNLCILIISCWQKKSIRLNDEEGNHSNPNLHGLPVVYYFSLVLCKEIIFQ
jgi:SAM-dependent methyltransferase